jgi:hypothetical protein
MSENELGRALLACEAPPGHDTRQMIGRVLERDRWRMRLLTLWTLLLWLLLAAGVLFMVWFFFLFLEPRLWKIQQDQNSRDMKAWVTVGGWAAWFVAALALTTLLAALSTVWLVFASRRATLRQVNAQLAEISEQLRQIQQALAKPPAPPGSG